MFRSVPLLLARQIFLTDCRSKGVKGYCSSFSFLNLKLHGPSMFAVMAKICGVLCIQSSSISFDETSNYWSALKTPNFSAFHWSPCGSLVSIGQHFVATRVVHLPKSTETSLITELDQSGLNHQLLQLCTARTAWSDSDQGVRAVHSCNSWLSIKSQGSPLLVKSQHLNCHFKGETRSEDNNLHRDNCNQF